MTRARCLWLALVLFALACAGRIQPARAQEDAPRPGDQNAAAAQDPAAGQPQDQAAAGRRGQIGPGRGGPGRGGFGGGGFGGGGQGGRVGRANQNSIEIPYDFEIPPAPALSPEEEMKTFKVVDGYHLELVAAEPLVVDPVALTFDPDGRMWVVEMRGFMPNVEGDGEDQPVGTISILEDTDHDGKMDTSHVYLDGLVMPRGLCWTTDGLLVCEQGIIWLCRDTNGDLVNDEKEQIATYLPGNLEHALNGLMPAMDNWIYNAKEGLRLRRVGGKWISDRTVDRGQWGMTQDDHGRLFYNNNADLIRGDLVPSYSPVAQAINPLVNVQLYREQEVWPIRVNPGINRGYDPAYLRPDGTMINANSDCGPVVYRGDNLPSELLGDIFISETVGNLVRRQVLQEDDSGVFSVNAYADEKKEFIASTDERFRPVNMFNAPDGTMYLVDMYRGVVQHAAFVTPFLRNQILTRNLEQPIHMGRIFRVVHETTQRRESVALGQASGEELVAYLSHPNGWHRDMAQQLLVQHGDLSVVPALRRLATGGESPLGRLHALWTLEGLNKLDGDLVFEMTSDSDPNVRAAAVYLCSRFLGPDPNPALIQELAPLADDPDPIVRMHLALTLGLVNNSLADEALAPILKEAVEKPERLQSLMAGLAGQEVEFIAARVQHSSWAQPAAWREDLLSTFAGLLWQQRNPLAVLRLFHLLSQIPADRTWQQVTLLEGLTAAPARGGDRGGRAGRGGLVGGGPAGGRGAGARRAGGGRGGAGRGAGGLAGGRGARGGAIRLVTLPAAPEGLDALRNSADERISAAANSLADQLIWPGKDGQPLPTKPALSAQHQALYDQGRTEYMGLCAGCHHPSGYGDAGKGPSLLDSEWLENDNRLINLVLFGLRGPVTINEDEFNPTGVMNMPGMYNALSDEKIAAALTYVRRELSLSAGPIEPAAVAAIRSAAGGRTDQWTEAELRAIE